MFSSTLLVDFSASISWLKVKILIYSKQSIRLEIYTCNFQEEDSSNCLYFFLVYFLLRQLWQTLIDYIPAQELQLTLVILLLFHLLHLQIEEIGAIRLALLTSLVKHFVLLQYRHGCSGFAFTKSNTGILTASSVKQSLKD